MEAKIVPRHHQAFRLLHYLICTYTTHQKKIPTQPIERYRTVSMQSDAHMEKSTLKRHMAHGFPGCKSLRFLILISFLSVKSLKLSWTTLPFSFLFLAKTFVLPSTTFLIYKHSLDQHTWIATTCAFRNPRIGTRSRVTNRGSSPLPIKPNLTTSNGLSHAERSGNIITLTTPDTPIASNAMFVRRQRSKNAKFASVRRHHGIDPAPLPGLGTFWRASGSLRYSFGRRSSMLLLGSVWTGWRHYLFRKLQTRPSRRTFPRLAIGGYRGRSDGEHRAFLRASQHGYGLPGNLWHNQRWDVRRSLGWGSTLKNFTGESQRWILRWYYCTSLSHHLRRRQTR